MHPDQLLTDHVRLYYFTAGQCTVATYNWCHRISLTLTEYDLFFTYSALPIALLPIALLLVKALPEYFRESNELNLIRFFSVEFVRHFPSILRNWIPPHMVHFSLVNFRYYVAKYRL